MNLKKYWLNFLDFIFSIPNRYWFVMIIYVLMQLSAFVTVPIFMMLFKFEPIDSLVYSQLFGFALATVLSLLILRKDITNELKDNDTTIGKIISWSIIGIFLAYLAQFVAASIEMFVLNIEPGSENTADIMNVINASTIFLLIPAIFAPILEELLFRKIIFGSLYKRINFFWAAILSSLAFGVIHLDLTHLLIYTGMGLVFSYLYVKTKTIIVPILVHMGMNTITVLMQLTVDIEELERMQNELSSIINFIGGLLICFLALFIFYLEFYLPAWLVFTDKRLVGVYSQLSLQLLLSLTLVQVLEVSNVTEQINLRNKSFVRAHLSVLTKLYFSSE